MKKQFTLLSSLLTIVVVSFVGWSCDEDSESTPLPTADFDSSVDVLTATFTNTSVDGLTYSWDFGDEASSTDESPSHTYAQSGAYLVKLTATNSTGSDEKTAALEVVVKITIDGDMSDWNDVEALSVKHSDSVGVVNIVKATSDLENIYFYVEGTDAIHGFVQMYLNSDNDVATGWGNLAHPKCGADWELDAGETGELWPWNGEDGTDGWSFEGDVVVDELGTIFYVPRVMNAQGNAFEFALIRTGIPSLAGTISFALGDVDTSNDGWNEHGYLPMNNEDYIELELFK